MAIDIIRAQPETAPHWREMLVLAQDPSVRQDGRIVRAKVRVPRERLDPGPRGHRFQVVDYDATRNRRVVIHRFENEPAAERREQELFGSMSDEELVDDQKFRAQNAYAIAARTLAAFEGALGRRIPWGFGGHQLAIVPAAFREANAYYDPDAEAVLLGYFDEPGDGHDGARTVVYTSLSHDIVAHETTHAVLDGLRSRFQEPGLPDQAAFHEAFADIVALLSVFSIRELVEHALGRPDAEGLIGSEQVDPAALKETVLLGLAEEMGRATTRHRGTALRRSVKLAPSTTWRGDPDYDEPHRRGEILVAAVMQTLVEIWAERLEALRKGGRPVDRARAAEEGAKAADHLLKMSIRAIDYTPPLEFAFEDFLDALIVSDAEIAPDDEHDYRGSLRRAFGAFGIIQPASRIIDLSSLREQPAYQALHFEELQSRTDEVYRFIWDNSWLLGVPIDQFLAVESVQPSVRIGPDGFVVQEVVATYVQMLEGPADEVRAFAESRGGRFDIPTDVRPDTLIKILGGGTLIFDQFGRAKYHQRKDLYDWERQSARLAYLARNGLSDTRNRFGFSLGTPGGQRFAILHEPGVVIEEVW